MNTHQLGSLCGCLRKGRSSNARSDASVSSCSLGGEPKGQRCDSPLCSGSISYRRPHRPNNRAAGKIACSLKSLARWPGHFSIESRRFNRIPSSRPNQGTMANSAFWRDLAVQFSALRDRRKLRPGGANDSMFISALKTLAMRGASEIAVAGTSDLLHIWLEELRKQGLPFQSSGQSDEVLSEAEYSERIYKDFTDGLCEASATFCNRREAQAVQ